MGVEVEEVLAEEDQWEWEAFSKAVCPNYAQLEMVLQVDQWAGLLFGPQEPGPQPLGPLQAVPPHPPLPINPLHLSTSAPTAHRCLTSPAPAVAPPLAVG